MNHTRQPQGHLVMEMLFKPLAHDCDAVTDEGRLKETVAGAVMVKVPVTAVPNVLPLASIAATEKV